MGIPSARSDDTMGLKGAVLDWITPHDVPLHPPLSQRVKAKWGFHHPIIGALLCPAGLGWNDARLVLMHISLILLIVHGKLSSGEIAVRGDQQPLLVYANQSMILKNIRRGFFRSQLLVSVNMHLSLFAIACQVLLQVYRTSLPCSVW